MKGRRRTGVVGLALGASWLAIAYGATNHAETIPPAAQAAASLPIVMRPLVPKPGAVPPPANEAPGCSPQEAAEAEHGQGRAGICAPRSRRNVAPPRAATGHTGPDTSNNDPLYRWVSVRSRGHEFAWVKLTDGWSFVDRTAAAQVAAIRRAGIVPGGYDYFQVCRASAAAEATLFLSRLRALGLVSGSLVPVGDAESPRNVPCSVVQARDWISAWIDDVHRLTGRWPAIYTGAWWWNPEIGCWWPPHARSWISGYGVTYPYLPCGLRRLDAWQYTDHGFNGQSYSDMSLLFVPLSELAEPTHRELQEELWRDYRYRSALRMLLTIHHCRRPPWSKPTPSTRAFVHACHAWIGEGATVGTDIRHLHRKGFF